MRKIKLSESELISIVRRIVEDSNDESEDSKPNLLLALRAYAKGNITKDELYSADKDIEYINTKNPLGQSLLTIKFDDDRELLDLLGLDDDDRWFLNAMNSYNGYEFTDSSQIEQDFNEGYIIYYDLNEENREKLKTISSVLLSGEEFNLDNEEFRIKLSSILLETFPNEIDYILSDYHIEKEREMNTVAQKAIDDEFFDVLKGLGIDINRDYDEITITLADLYSSALQSNLYNDNAKQMVTNIFKNSLGNNSIGGWLEDIYNFTDSNEFDSESFNREVERQFDKILEELETEDNDNSLKDYIELIRRVTNKFNLNDWYSLPTNNKYSFKISGFDRDDFKIRVELRTPMGYKVVKLTEENFNYLLYQPTLFNLDDI